MADTEVKHASLDERSLTVLLNELCTDIPEEITKVLNDGELNHEILEYLNGISSIESRDYLSSVPPTPAADGTLIEERTLIQDIAELEASQRSIDSNLKSLIVKSHSSIIDNKVSLNKSIDMFQNEFNSSLKLIWKTFNEDSLNEYGDDKDPDLHELETDLDQKDQSQNTIRSTIAKIKNHGERDNENNKHLSVVLENIDQITSILELPTLTGACIKAGYYAEALEISSYTRRLAIRFPKNDLIKEVENGIKNEMSYMLTGLIRLLRTNLKQSSLIKTLSYLKRIPPFSQTNDSQGQLKRILLHARYQFIRSELDSLVPLKESELWENYLKRSIEVIREHCFGSIMTYKSVFPDIDDSELGDVIITLEPISDSTEEEENVEEVKEEAKEEVKEDQKEDQKDEQDSRTTEEADAKADGSDNEQKEDDDKDKNNTKVEESETDSPSEKPNAEETGKDVNEPEAESEKTPEETTEEGNKIEKVPQKDIEEKIFGNKQVSRPQSNTLLFDFVKHVIEEIIPILRVSLTNIPQPSIRDGLYLQLIYSAKSLTRIDENFGDLTTQLFLNAKSDDGSFIIDREAWISALEKQKKLATSLNRS